MMPSLISVVMGVRNGAPCLHRSLESVLGQEGVELEVIVIDDGSTDETPGILAEMARRDTRLRVSRQEKAGLTRALIRGCAAARGDVIARQDADDTSLPGRLATQVALLDGDPGLVMASCWSECVGPRDELLFRVTPELGSEDATRELRKGRHHPSAHGSVVFRRDAYERVGGYRAAFYYAQDSDLWQRLADEGRLGYAREVLYRFAMQPSSISRSHRHLQLEFDRLAQASAAARRGGTDEGVFLEEAARLGHAVPSAGRGGESAAYFIGRCLLDRHDPRAGGYLLAALREIPLSPRVWLALARYAMMRGVAPADRPT
jgi:glycosyltransferase involved in cell wall biosynthesis